ncbi:CLOCK-interacting pacemaker [Anas acuta]|uniref:CLOCK interacting pacemaker n=2 Tax=Anas TaxID=8835 RepID=U3J0A9_ANAPP|nr:CLOCK-interacting pacemaker [Anas platyrhynchos]XP_038035957.1 CLOCK-interacting pacemaker [Anas platyrhynchos]XP_038035958.1 CLOCK-interacting pacemaker [Anas platyrhynchos]XP_038035959.1 CLOCK-interacting pacemaker [Anas platyrhynchos]XP_038035960.1 CLOCK-interacting pacemaker [Anas platyrhynchos]|eukprot:XP_027314052.1 CLOCK-interacting pacemaker isoform X1 [Anas platyrhynchos]
MAMKSLNHHFSMAATESDKDSGYSDGSSECLSAMEQTDSEDVLNALCWNAEDGPWPCPVTTSNSFPALSPMVVMKNVLVKQGSSSQLQSWTVQPSFEVIPAQPQLVFLHPSIPPPINPHPAGKKRNDSTNYLPILNSYPKIAPQPCKRDHSFDLEDRQETSCHKRLCTEAPKMETSPVSRSTGLPTSPFAHLPVSFKTPQDSSNQQNPSTLVTSGKVSALSGFHRVSADAQKLPGLAPLLPFGTLQAAKCTPHENESAAQTPMQSAVWSPPLIPEETCTTPELLLQQQSKCRRFQNTLVVLRRSGLLEITLKTKELIHQNQVTQAELDRLKHQTQLFIEAIKNNAPQSWAELEASLTGSEKTNSNLEDSAYPNM